MNKTLIISPSLFGSYFTSNNCDIIYLYKRRNIIKKVQYFIAHLLHLKIEFNCISKKALYHLSMPYDNVIIFDNIFHNKNYNETLEILKTANSKRIIIFFWNIIKFDIDRIPKSWEKWTFDKNESLKYSMKYNGTFYPVKSICKNKKQKYDIFFAGLDKGRKEEINQIKIILDTMHIKTKIMIMSKDLKKIIINNHYPYLPYKKILKYTQRSNAILDITINNQEGLTLRVMESLALRKKLITNNKSINRYIFYNTQNIFIIGIDSYKNLETFLKTPYKDIDFNINTYNINSWLYRITHNEELKNE